MKQKQSRRKSKAPGFSNATQMAISITLPSGATAEIETGKGRHVRQAQKMSESDSNMYLNCMMSQLVTIDGRKLVPEDFDEMSAGDYLELLGKFSEANFTLAQNK